MNVELDEEERKLLLAILWDELREIQPLLHHTHSLEWKEGLHDRMELVRRLIDRLDLVHQP